MGRGDHTAGLRLGRGAVLALASLMITPCDELSGFDEDEKEPPPPAEKEEKPWIRVGIKACLDAYPLTEKSGIEYCGILCQQTPEQVLATGPRPGTRTDCDPWKSPCPAGTKAIGTYHTEPIGALNEANPRRPFSQADILDGQEPYDFIGLALVPRTKAGVLVVHVYMFERGIQTECQVHPTVICPFPPIPQGATP